MIYDSSGEAVGSNPTQEIRTDKEAEAMAKRKSGLPNWLLLDDQEIEEWNLGSKQDPKMIKINKHLKKEPKDKAWNLFLKLKDVFAWEHTDLKGVDSKMCQIPLKSDARLVRLQRYRMNPNYAKKVKEEIGNPLKAGFITEVERSDWLFLIVVVLKKNGQLRVCVDYRKLNAKTIKDAFLLPFIDMMLDEIAGHEMYNFMDNYSGNYVANVLRTTLKDTLLLPLKTLEICSSSIVVYERVSSPSREASFCMTKVGWTRGLIWSSSREKV
ncbi:hypothetical protein L7F22_045274 [Adiantum nelumboides]|nr:hypothetical protein [Adiantum nelumboides]